MTGTDTATYVTPFELQYRDALKAVRRRGVKVRQNIMQCCRGCVSAEQLGMTDDTIDDTPHVWTYGGQGCAISWRDGWPVLRNPTRWSRDEKVTDIIFNHGGPDLLGAMILCEEMETRGIKIDWDNTMGKCVIVKVPWPEETTA